MNKISKVILAIIVALMLAIPVLPTTVFAAPPTDRMPDKVKEKLPPGWERANPNALVQHLGVEKGKGKNGEDIAAYEMTISSLPTTMPDNETLIDTQWYLQSDDSGQTWYQSGVNMFTARVQGGRVSVEDADGHLAIWNSRVVLGGHSVSGGTATIVDDPLNENYTNNTLAWDYGEYATGYKSSAIITRYLRSIEGLIQELWLIPEKPNSGILLEIRRSEESSFDGRVEWLTIWDSDGRTVPVGVNLLGMFIITEDNLNGLTYPVWIDPTIDLSTSASDGFMYAYDAVYATARTAASANSAQQTTPSLNVGQALSYGEYYIHRPALFVNTASVPDTATITASSLWLAGIASADRSDTEFSIQVQSGMPTYPHDPLVVSDFSYTHYSGNGGTFSTTYWATGSTYNLLNLNSTGISWINKTGITKFLLRSSREIAGTIPTGYEYVGIQSYEYGIGFQPKMLIAYTAPITTPTVSTNAVASKGYTSGTLRATLTDDGGEACSTRFQYDVSTAYSYATAWQSGYTTGELFSVLLSGLTPGELYYYRGQASNSVGTGTGSGGTFITNPNPAYGVSATPGNTQVVLAWSKGTGADKTMVRSSTTGYPDTPTDGTQVYFDTGTGETDAGLVNGTTYYYSIWSYATEGGLEDYSLDRTTISATPAAPALATVITNAATSVGVSDANINLSLTSLGGYGSADVSFEYATNAYYVANGSTYDESTTPVNATAIGTLSENIDTLDAATVYHFRARAENPTGWAYGVDRTFTTGDVGAPEMTTSNASSVQLTSAQLNGTVADDGGVPPITVYFEWGLTTAYGSTTPIASGLGTGSTFYYGLSGLEPDTEYHYRAVGENTEGTGYGLDKSFTTDAPTAPTAETLDATLVGSHEATLQGQVLTDGGVEVEVGFEYGLDAGYGEETAWVDGYRTGQTFSAIITGLDIDTDYHFRARVRNDGGTGNGDDNTLTTVFSAPTGFVATATSYSSIGLGWTKQGDQTYIAYKTSGYPIDREDGTQAYFGSASTASLSGLTAGTTYYFKAWSWASGDLWADTTAAAIATTLSSSVPGEEEDAPSAMIAAPDAPDNWSGTPSGTKLANLPGYDALETAREGYEVPEDTFYFSMAMLLTFGLAVVGLVLSKKIVVGVVAGAFTVGVCAWLGMVSGFMVLVYILLAGGSAFLLSRRGSEV